MALLLIILSSACSDDAGVTLPPCDTDAYVSQLRAEWSADLAAPPGGIYVVSRSGPTGIALVQDDETVEIEFPSTEGSLLPAIDSEIEMTFNSEDSFFVSMREPATDALLFEAGDATIIFPPASGHMTFHDLGDPAHCRGLGPNTSVSVAEAAVSFQTDAGSVILSSGQETTASIDGNPVRLRVLLAIRMDHDDGVFDASPSFTEATIVRLPP